MTRQILRRAAGILILVCSLAALAWAFWPLPEETSRIAILPQNMQLPASPDGADVPAVREKRLVELRWSPSARLGDPQVIRLALTAEPQAGPPAGPDVYATHNVLADASLELPGLVIAPGSAISSPLRPGRSATFLWRVTPRQAGDYSGDLSLHLGFIPLSGGAAAEESRLVSSQRIEIQTVSLFGLSGPAARLLGVSGAVLGFLLGFDRLLKRLAVWAIGRLKTGP